MKPALRLTLTTLLVCFAPRVPWAQTWTQTGAPSNVWAAIACSAVGTKLGAAAGGQSFLGQIYTSTNGGTNWTPTGAPSNHWTAIASSSDGSRLAATAYGTGIFTSTNSGATWASNNIANGSWLSVSSSADGFQ